MINVGKIPWLGREESYFVRKKIRSDSAKKSLKLIAPKWSSFWLTTYLLLCLVDVYIHQTVGIPMGTSFAPLFVDLFPYSQSYEADSMQGLLRENEKKLARFFNFMCHYIYHIISQNYSKFGDFVDHIYPIDITDTAKSASYLDLHLEIDSEGRLRTKPYDKRDDFNFPIVNFP